MTPIDLAAERARCGLGDYARPEPRKKRKYGIIDWEAYKQREEARRERERERHRRKAAERREGEA